MKLFKIQITIICLAACLTQVSCNKEFLEEVPLSQFSTVGVLTSEAGFNNYITALHAAARDEMSARDGSTYFYIMQNSTDVASFGNISLVSNNYATLLTPTANAVGWVWNWAYSEMLLRANTIIAYASKPELDGIWSSPDAKKTRS